MTDPEELTDPEEPVIGVYGVCCSCGYAAEEETPCFEREDGTHCEHWWDGSWDGPEEFA